MKFTPLPINGSWLIEIDPIQDERGFFARTWCREEFAAHGLRSQLEQCSVSFNHKRGTLRGMHYQVEPYPEAKLVRCTSGAIYDVIIDLRPQSSSFMKWTALELSAENRCMAYVPEGCAHGFQTLQDDTEVFYQMTEKYVPQCARGVRYNDPAFDIRWPLEVSSIAERDSHIEDFVPADLNGAD